MHNKKKNKEQMNQQKGLNNPGSVTAEMRAAGDESAVTKVTEEAKQDEKGDWRDFFKITKDDIKTIVFTVIAALLLVKFVAQPVMVDGHSMDDTLYHGERLLIEKVSRYFDAIDRYDIIVFDPENDMGVFYIKRVIGLPGETVRIDDEGNIYINGERLEDDIYGMEEILDPGRAWEEITLGDDEYFVMGDNRNDSLDSRFDVGNVSRSQIIGRVVIQIFPFHKVR